MKEIRLYLFLALFTLIAGCGGKEPLSIVEVEGVLLLDEKPLPLALIEFMPELKGHGAEANSTAVTDAQGKFKLVKGTENGAVLSSHRVVVNEGPPPDGARGQDAASQAKLTEYMNALKNRPIPPNYSNYSQTPLRVEIKAADKNLILKMTR